MRTPVLLFSLGLFLAAMPGSHAQDSDSVTQQNPGAVQDAVAAREKLLKASDQLDNIQANSETTKLAVDGMKGDVAALQASVTKLQSDNAALKQQLADTQAAFEQYKADQVKARQALIDNVADMIAAGKGSTTPTKLVKKKKEPVVEASPPAHDPAPAANLAPPPEVHSTTPAPSSSPTTVAETDSAKPQKGYYHIVASGETLTLICAAYRENGVNVTVSEIKKANGLTGNSTLKAGQKLFIPKPGT